MRAEEAKKLLPAGEELLLEEPRAVIRVTRPDMIGVRGQMGYVVLTNRRLLACRRSLLRGYVWTEPFVNLPIDHIETWESTKTLRMPGLVMRRLRPFIRIESVNPTATVGFTVSDPKAWLATLERHASELHD